MRITSIDIRNYRQYQSLNFSFPKTKSTDLHILIAQNGVGKTNLLNAITWCLYGNEPHLGSEKMDQGLPIINLTAIELARSNGSETEYVEVEIQAKDGLEFITYKRRLPVRITADIIFPEDAREEFTITVATDKGDPKIYDNAEDTKRLIDKYMPEKIREYFYFDGEQLNNYFINERVGKIKEAIFSISQVDMINIISKRIGDIINDKKKEASNTAPDLKKISEKLSSIDVQITNNDKKISELDEQIALSKQIISDNTEYLRGEENLPELEKEYQELKDIKNTLDEEKKEHNTQMITFVREMKVALALYEASKKTLDIIAQKEAEKALPPNIDKDLLQKALDENTCVICNQTFSEKERELVRKLIDSFKVSSVTSNLLMAVKSELERIITTVENYPQKKEEIVEKFKRIDERFIKVDSKLQEVDTRINLVSDKEEVKRRHKERHDHDELLEINIEKIGVTKEQLKNAKDEKDRLDKEFKKALDKDIECSRIRQLIGFAEQGRSIMDSIESEMMDEVRKKMEDRTTHYFTELVWKKNTYDRILLNDEFQLDLIHKDGYSSVGTCSAAERALLALSFTLALHEVSGFNSLLFIDTPVARVSDENRKNFARVLCDVSNNKQIIMTFTPDEYSPEIERVFDESASSKEFLKTVDEKITVMN